MKISLKWLKEYVDVPDLPENLQAFCDKLDLTGTGVEDIVKIGANFDNIVTGQIISKEKHPDSDHMWVTKVDVGSAHTNEDGKNEPLQIVCGAQNFNQGDHICVALIGAVLQGKFKIKKSKLRGINSYGMNCSEEELGLADSSEGIMILPDDAPVGMPIAQYLGLSDVIIDTEITPNRPDCLSVVGCAREIAAIYDVPYKNPLEDMADKIHDCEIENLTNDLEDHDICALPSVEIVDKERCQRYTARVIKDVKVGPSPKWLVERLNSMGARSINNIVDITNYILYLFGQPLHAFDYDKLKDKNGDVEIIVRPAKNGEEFRTLDGEDRVLNHDMTVIANSEKAVALAGVMGGENSEVTEETTTILLETATFSPAHTSRTSRNLGLISESSMRYERRVDDADIDVISAASATLIAELANGTILSNTASMANSIVDEWCCQTQNNKLKFRVERFHKMMGAYIETSFIKKTLINLGCEVSGNETILDVITPTFRPDLEREIDLYEEVLRIYGMDKILPTLPKSSERVGHKTYTQRTIKAINDVLVSSGLHETISYSFADINDVKFMGGKNDALHLGKSVELLNPMNAQQKFMRQSIVPGLLRSVSYNLNHGVQNVSLYEIGAVFNAKNGQQRPKESTKLSAVIAGQTFDTRWNHKPYAVDFFDAKGVVENIIYKLNIPKVRYKVLEHDVAPHLQPGRAAEVLSKGSSLGWIGEIHPKVSAKFEIEEPVAAFELDLDALISCSQEFNKLEDIPVFPGIDIDVAFIVDKNVNNEMMMQRISSAGGKLLKNVQLFDVYTKEKHVGEGKKSMAYKLKYSDPDKTLKREDVEKVHNKLIDKVCRSTGAKIRS